MGTGQIADSRTLGEEDYRIPGHYHRWVALVIPQALFGPIELIQVVTPTSAKLSNGLIWLHRGTRDKTALRGVESVALTHPTTTRFLDTTRHSLEAVALVVHAPTNNHGRRSVSAY